MAGDEPRDYMRIKNTYTFNEAIDYMIERDKKPTNMNESISWFNAKTALYK
jgi:hypothetical protein